MLGASRDCLAHVVAGLETEINAVNDNPIFGLADGWVTSNSGNFHGQRAAELLDYLANSISSIAVMSERRAARLVDANHNGGLPPFLIHPQAAAGENSGFMIAQYTAAALVAELRTRATAAAIQSVPTCANTEDHVPMVPSRCWRAFRRGCGDGGGRDRVLARRPGPRPRGIPPAPALRHFYELIRAQVPTMVQDRVMGEDIAAVRGAIAEVGAADLGVEL